MNSYENINWGIQDNLYGKETKTESACDVKNDCQNSKSMKYFTTTFTDLDPQNLSSLNRGIYFSNGYSFNGDLVKESSELRNAISTQKPCDGLGPAPLRTTGGFYRGNGDVEVENNLRALDDTTNKACNYTDDGHYYTRTMGVFSQDTPSPYLDAAEFLLPNEIQYGVNSRNASSKKYSRTYTGSPSASCM